MYNYKEQREIDANRLPDGINYVLERIFLIEQNDFTSRPSPSASVGDIIELEDGRKFRIEDEGFTEAI